MLVSDAIQAAYREANIIVIGDEPTADETAEALSRLNDFRVKLFGSEFGENLEDWPVPPANGDTAIPDNLVSPDYGSTWYLTPKQNSRLLVNISTAQTIKFPASPNDGARMMIRDVGSTGVNLTLDGNGRLIEGQATLVETPAILNGAQWFYRADLASWERVEDLAVDDELPLPDEYNDLFICYLAIRLSPRHSQVASEDTKSLFNALLKQAKARYRQEQAVSVTPSSRVSESEQSFGLTGSRLGWY